MIVVDIEKQLNTYHGGPVLRVKEKFHKGCITKIHGPSGAGKSTLLKLIAGFMKPDKGVITANDITWTDTSKKLFVPPQNRKAGFVFQDYALFPNMTVMEHLQYGTKDLVWIAKLIHFGRLEAFADQKPHFLSGGQQQRLAILRALAIKPNILLMDEPFSALDRETKETLIADLKILIADLNATTLIVSHNPQELDTLPGHELLIRSCTA